MHARGRVSVLLLLFRSQGSHILARLLEDEKEKKGAPAPGPRQASIARGCECQESSTANQSCRGLQYQISLSSLIMHPLMDWGMRNRVSSRKLPCSLNSRPWGSFSGPSLVVVAAAKG